MRSIEIVMIQNQFWKPIVVYRFTAQMSNHLWYQLIFQVIFFSFFSVALWW